VAGGLKAVLPLAPAIINVHAGGGRTMMRTAAEAVRDWDGPKPMLIGVTVLTSLDSDDLAEAGVPSGAAAQVDRLAALAKSSGLDGVVCSSHEIARLRAALGPDFKLVVPGIRPAGSGVGDQKRVMTPGEAFGLGADLLVFGRPSTQAADPAAAARAIAGGRAAAAGRRADVRRGQDLRAQ
jgi:orotidine-5'-phosphate decarboxylase